MMKKKLNRLTTVILLSAVLVTGSFALTGEETFAASKSPAQPKITKAAVYDSNNVKLQWSKAKGAVKYKVYRKKADGKYKLVKTTKSRTYYSKSLAYGTKYTYKVKAVSKSGKVRTSKVKSVTTGKKTEPTVTVRAPIYEDDTVYWIKHVDTKEVLWKGTSYAEMEREMDRLDEAYFSGQSDISPVDWHWGSGGVKIIVGYGEPRTYTVWEWENDCDPHNREDYLVTYN